MSKRQDEDFFRHLISGMDSKLQTELNWMYAHKRMRDDWERKNEMERMKKEIVEDVLSRISLNIEERITETLNRVFAEFERK